MLRHIVRGIAGLTAGALALALQPADLPSAPEPTAPFRLDEHVEPVADVRLEAARDCTDLTARIRDIARAQAARAAARGPTDRGRGALIPGSPTTVPMSGDVAADGSMTPASSGDAMMAPMTAAPAMPGNAGSTGPRIVGTNVRDARVDEADIIKTDGSTIFVLRGRALHAVDADSLELVDRIDVTANRWTSLEMLVVGDRLVVFENVDRWRDPRVRLTIVDVSDPSTLTLASDLTIEGSLLAGRLVDGFIRIVTSSEPRFAGHPRDLSIADVVPAITVNGMTTRQRRAACDAVYLTPDATSLRSTTVTSIDPADPKPVGTATALSDDGIVYTTPISLYIADPRWGRPGRTEIHRFAISDPRHPEYVSSGSVAGTPLNAFSLDEHEGLLRIATTRGGRRQERFRDESQVSVLREDGALLTQIGTVDGLGVNERIYAVRFMADRAYVVTFRQIDPLYVLDLTDPTQPRITGELKIPGFSEYLHPLNDARLVGVGQSASRIDGSGVQVSLFDVADPTQPQRVSTVDGLGTYSPIGDDHRSFQHLADRDLIVVPTESWEYSYRKVFRWRTEQRRIPDEETSDPGDDTDADASEPLDILDPPDTEEEQPDAGAEPKYTSERIRFREVRWAMWTKSRAHIIRIDGDEMRVVGRVNHAPLARASEGRRPARHSRWTTSARGIITRTIAIGDVLYALSGAGMTATDLDSMLETDELIW